MALEGLGGDEGDVVVLIVGTVEADFVDDVGDEFAGRKCVVAAEGFDEALFAEFFEGGIEGFGDAIGVKGERVARMELAFADFAIPIAEGTEDGGGGVQGFEGRVSAENEAGEMAAVDVAEAAGGVVVLGEEKGGEGAVGGVFAEELIDGAEQAQGIVAVDGALAAEIGLEIGHEQGGGDAFAGNVADDEAEAGAAETQEVVVIAADGAGLVADAGVVERREFGEVLREEARLHLFGDFEFLGGALLGFEAMPLLAALEFDGAGDFVEADQGEEVAVGIAEAAEGAAPDGIGFLGRFRARGLVGQNTPAALQTLEARSAGKLHAAGAPLAELAHDVFGDEGDVGVAADKLVIGGIALGDGQGEVGFAVGRREDSPGVAGAVAGVEDKLEAEGVDVEVDAAFEVAHEDGGGLQAEERRMWRGARGFRLFRGACHGDIINLLFCHHVL